MPAIAKAPPAKVKISETGSLKEIQKLFMGIRDEISHMEAANVIKATTGGIFSSRMFIA
jgi:hypothetical protein